MAKNSNKLNVGCGTKILAGWVNLDKFPLSGVDVVHDIEKLPLPFPDNKFDEILCENILEHVEYVPILKELHRILRKGGRLRIGVPHFTSRTNFVDPTHKKLFSVQTFTFFVNSNSCKTTAERKYYFDFHFEKIVSTKITFSKYFFYNYPLYYLVNIHPKIQSFYELTFLSRLFPAENIEVEIEK